MNNKIILCIIVSIIAAFILISCHTENNMKSSNETQSYSKNEEKNYSYKTNSDEITLNSYCSNLKIIKSDSNEIKVNMKKVVSGDNEEKLQQALDNTKCDFEDDVIKIGPEKDISSLVKSINIKATISIPINIKSLEVTSDVSNIDLEGDYNNFKTNMKTGNLSYKGELKQCNIVSNNGRIKLELQNIEPNYKYEISGENGDIDITIPRDNSINLVGTSTQDANVQNGIKFDRSSTTFDINKTISRINIHN